MIWPFRRKKTVPLGAHLYALVSGWYMTAFYANDHAAMQKLQDQYRGTSEPMADLMDFFSIEHAETWADTQYQVRRIREDLEREAREATAEGRQAKEENAR